MSGQSGSIREVRAVRSARLRRRGAGAASLGWDMLPHESARRDTAPLNLVHIQATSYERTAKTPRRAGLDKLSGPGPLGVLAVDLLFALHTMSLETALRAGRGSPAGVGPLIEDTHVVELKVGEGLERGGERPLEDLGHGERDRP